MWGGVVCAHAEEKREEKSCTKSYWREVGSSIQMPDAS